jgi:DHA1 family bicyclomycin/chloramphenicol resistance-like MFS transporter
VVTVALVRDCFSGRPMARVMSLIFIVFLIVPVIAPTLGQVILEFGGTWRTIFWIITGSTGALLAWFMLRMPETLSPEDRVEISIARLTQGYRKTLSDRWSVGYALASGMLQAALIGYLTSIPQIMAETFGRETMLNVIFAVTAGTMGLANFANSRLVLRLGSRRISHSALVMLIVLGGAGLAVSHSGYETMWVFAGLQALTMGCFGLANANFQAMAMENMGDIAGTASSVQGVIVMTLGTVGGSLIGLSFAGTTTPLHLGILAAGILAFAIVFVAERGRMFRPV